MTIQSNQLSASDIERFGSDPTVTFRQNLAFVYERIERACARVGRDPGTVQLLPITKTVPPHILRLAFAAGIRSCGENKIQEAQYKAAELADLPLAWHIVGHLQTNKVKYMTRFASSFHALDSIRLAEAINKRLEQEQRTLDVFIQVNTSNEESKFGLEPSKVGEFVEELRKYPRLKPQGLMSLALFSDDMTKVRPCFQMLKQLREEAFRLNENITKLSMGMSGDFEEAIEEGANIVRVGQAIFGKRPTPDSHYWAT